MGLASVFKEEEEEAAAARPRITDSTSMRLSGIADLQRHSADWWLFAGRWGRGAQGVTAQGSGLAFRSGGNTLK